MEPAFRTSGLASGIDTTALIEQLMKLEQRPLALLKDRKAAITIQISSMSSLAGKLDALKSAATTLKSSGVGVITVAGTYNDFTVGGAAAAEGRYTVKVEALAKAGKLRTTSEFATPTTAVTTGDEIRLKIDGTAYVVTGLTNKGIGDVAAIINQQLSSVTASVVSTGTGYHLSIARKDTGYVIGQPAASAIELDTAFVNADAGLGLIVPVGHGAANAKVHVDGVIIERRTNDVANVIPGATLNLKAASNTDVDLVFAKNASSSAANLQKFVDGFNGVAKFLKDQLRPVVGVSRSDETIGTSTLVAIQSKLQGLLSLQVNTTGSIRSLSDLGIKLQKDGTVLLDQPVLDAALAKDASAVNTIFSKATSGIGDTVDTYVKAQTNGIDGMLVTRRRSLEDQNKRLDQRSLDITRRLAARKEQLVKQFTAMERVMSSFNAIGSYLQSQKLPGFTNNTE